MLLGADNLSLEAFPSEREDNWVPVHTFLLAEKGVMFIEQMFLEEMAKDQIYEFAFIAASLKLRILRLICCKAGLHTGLVIGPWRSGWTRLIGRSKP